MRGGVEVIVQARLEDTLPADGLAEAGALSGYADILVGGLSLTRGRELNQ